MVMQFIENEGKKFIVEYKKSVQFMTDDESIKFRDEHGYDMIFKNNEAYHFCKLVPEATFVEYAENDTQIIQNSKE